MMVSEMVVVEGGWVWWRRELEQAVLVGRAHCKHWYAELHKTVGTDASCLYYYSAMGAGEHSGPVGGYEGAGEWHDWLGCRMDKLVSVMVSQGSSQEMLESASVW